VKKPLLLIISFVYLLSVTGLSFDLHYCMGKLADVEWPGVKNDKCGRCGMQNSKKKSGCCHNEPRFVKISDEHQYSNAFQVTEPGVYIVQLPEFAIPGTEMLPVYSRVRSFHAFVYSSPPLYLRYRVFRI
jgi:hypothetical protein